MAQAKKKTPHWTRLPRPKLIARVKRLELQLAKLKAQLAEMRETKLLNERAAVQGQADRLSGTAMDERFERIAACTASHAPNATTSAALEELTRNESMFPWETEDD